MKLYELDWALYPRRVGIYLAEKGITGIERIALDAMAPETAFQLKEISAFGTVPVLETQEGEKIRSSVAILEYLEECYSQPNMIGTTSVERARTREAMAIADEAAIQFGIWAHKCSPVFAGRETQHSTAARFGAEAYLKQLELLDLLLSERRGPFLTGANISMADCMALATIQFCDGGYGVMLPAYLTHLKCWYEIMRQRPSASCPVYPEAFLAHAYGLPEHCSPWSLSDLGWHHESRFRNH